MIKNTLNSAILFLSTAIIAACTPSQGCSTWDEGSTAYVYIDDPDSLFSQEELDLISSSFEEWEVAVDQHVVFQFVSGDDVPDSLITVAPDSLAHLMEDRGHGAVTDFTPFSRGGDITMPYDIGPKDFRLLLLHEIGHAIGLDHDKPGTVMAPVTAEAPINISCDDVCQFCEVNDCCCESMPPCLDPDWAKDRDYNR